MSKPPALHLREREISQQVRDFLNWKGWRILRNNVTTVRDHAGNWTSFGEKGMPDFTALFYLQHARPGMAVCLWVEVKQKDGVLRPHQVVWHRDETARGGLVVVARDFEEFERFYWEHFAWVHGEQGQGLLFQPVQ